MIPLPPRKTLPLPPRRPQPKSEMPPLSRPEHKIDTQGSLFDVQEDWKHEWRGMPEFVQESQKPYQTVLLHFASQEDVKAFAALVEQSINPETKYMWYPKADLKRVSKFRYVDKDSDAIDAEATKDVPY